VGCLFFIKKQRRQNMKRKVDSKKYLQVMAGYAAKKGEC